MEQNTLENLNMVLETDKGLGHLQMDINTLEDLKTTCDTDKDMIGLEMVFGK